MERSPTPQAPCGGPERAPLPSECVEIDEFHGANEGLVVAEIELASPEEEFERPAWLGEEVTADPRYANASLSRHPYSEW